MAIRWNRFVLHGDQRDEDVPMANTSGAAQPEESSKSAKGKGKGRAEHVFNLTTDIHASEVCFLQEREEPSHQFEVHSSRTSGRYCRR